MTIHMENPLTCEESEMICVACCSQITYVLKNLANAVEQKTFNRQ